MFLFLVVYFCIGVFLEIFKQGFFFIARKFPRNITQPPRLTLGSTIFFVAAWPMAVYFFIEIILSNFFLKRRLKKQMKRIIRDSIRRLKAEKIRNGEGMDGMNEFEKRFIPWADEAVEEAFRNNKNP